MIGDELCDGLELAQVQAAVKRAQRVQRFRGRAPRVLGQASHTNPPAATVTNTVPTRLGRRQMRTDCNAYETNGLLAYKSSVSLGGGSHDASLDLEPDEGRAPPRPDVQCAIRRVGLRRENDARFYVSRRRRRERIGPRRRFRPRARAMRPCAPLLHGWERRHRDVIACAVFRQRVRAVLDCGRLRLWPRLRRRSGPDEQRRILLHERERRRHEIL